MMPFKYAYTLPIICCGLFAVTFLITYLLSVARNDVVAFLPYISDTGTWSPESCIFGIMLNIGALLQAAIIYVRYRQVNFYLEKQSFDNPIEKYNYYSFIIGIIAALGVCVVANFQESNLLVAHLLGAVAAFGLGSVYTALQTYISYLLYPVFGSKLINIGRLICSILCCSMFFTTFVFAGLSLRLFTGKDTTKWTSSDGGFVLHIVSTITEWILMLSTMIFILLYVKEFRNVRISEPLLKDISSI